MKRNFVHIELNKNDVRDTIRHLANTDKRVRRLLGRVVASTAINIAKDTVSPSDFPYITGFLRGSYDSDTRKAKKNLTAQAFSVAEYAPTVEYFKPFFEPAVEKHTDRFYNVIDKIIEQATK